MLKINESLNNLVNRDETCRLDEAELHFRTDVTSLDWIPRWMDIAKKNFRVAVRSLDYESIFFFLWGCLKSVIHTPQQKNWFWGSLNNYL